jgi:hypothetical protein
MEKLREDLNQLISTAKDDLEGHGSRSCSAQYKALYARTLKDGLKSLIGTISKDDAWDDAMIYGREVILTPQDTARMASSPWVRSCSGLAKELIKQFGPETIEAARSGIASIIANHYDGNRQSIAHVNRKASYLRHCKEEKVGPPYAQRSPLAAGCYQSGMLPCSLALSAFLPIEKAVQIGSSLTLLSATTTENLHKRTITSGCV